MTTHRPLNAARVPKPLHVISGGVKALCAVVSLVISASLLGGVAVGITTPTSIVG